MNTAVFGKTIENLRKYRVVSEPSYPTTKFFTEHLLVIEMKKLKYLCISLFI